MHLRASAGIGLGAQVEQHDRNPDRNGRDYLLELLIQIALSYASTSGASSNQGSKAKYNYNPQSGKDKMRRFAGVRICCFVVGMSGPGGASNLVFSAKEVEKMQQLLSRIIS